MQNSTKLNLAVITGHHAFDVVALHTLFQSLPGIQSYIQPLGDFAADTGKHQNWYDVVLFYNFHQPTPGTFEEAWWEAGVQAILERLGESNQGIVVLHHGLLAFRDWDLWSDIVGIPTRGFGYHPEQSVHVEVAHPTHPITQGLNNWDITDETYTVNEPAPDDNEILLTTQHPKSMQTLAWTRTYKNARVFCYQSGHDGQAFQNENFQTVLTRGILWTAHKLPS